MKRRNFLSTLILLPFAKKLAIEKAPQKEEPNPMTATEILVRDNPSYRVQFTAGEYLIKDSLVAVDAYGIVTMLDKNYNRINY